MTSKQLDSITEQLAALHGHAYFRPEAGPLKERLTQTVLDALEGELAEQLADGAFDLEVSVGRQEGESGVTVGFSVDHPGVVHSGELAVELLTDPALEELVGYLARLGEDAVPVETADSKAVLRKKLEHDHHLKGPASARLKVSPEWLKSVIPCTDYSYDEIDGKKYIREYYWSKELIERLFKIKCTKTTPEDLQYVAAECCEGDLDWAKDLIARLKSPNRPEPAPKEQVQKGQGQKGQGQKGQGRPGVPRPGGGSPAPSERSRSRSRHKRPPREPGKEAPRSGEPAAAPKNPQK